MGRRLGRTVSTVAGERNSIGDYHVQQACNRLNKAAMQEAAMHVDRIPMDARLINALFNADKLSKLRQAYGLVEPSSWRHTYKLDAHAPGRVALSFDNTGTLPPEALCMEPNDAAKPFFAACRAIEQIHHRWGAVKFMLRWFNTNATVGAIRHYWPAAVVLCPDATPLRGILERPAERFNTPEGVTKYLPLIRETASTVATLQLLGDDRPITPNSGVRLTMPNGVATFAGTVIQVDELTYNL